MVWNGEDIGTPPTLAGRPADRVMSGDVPSLAHPGGDTHEMPAAALEEWIGLIRRYVDGSIPADEFAKTYFSLEREAHEGLEDGQLWIQPHEAARILDDLFVKIDRLSDGSKPRENGLAADELRHRARRAVLDLEQIAAGSSQGRGRARSVLGLATVSVLLIAHALVFAGYMLWRAARWLALQIVRPLHRG